MSQEFRQSTVDIFVYGFWGFVWELRGWILKAHWLAKDGCQLTCKLERFDGVAVVVIVQLLGRIWLFATPWSAARQASLSLSISWNLLKFKSIELVMPYPEYMSWTSLQHEGLCPGKVSEETERPWKMYLFNNSDLKKSYRITHVTLHCLGQ